jgi:hypothetical protein
MASALLVAALVVALLFCAAVVWWASHDVDYCDVVGVSAAGGGAPAGPNVVAAGLTAVPVLELAPRHRKVHPGKWTGRTIIGSAAALGGSFRARVAHVATRGRHAFVTLDRPMALVAAVGPGGAPVLAAARGDNAFIPFKNFFPWK